MANHCRACAHGQRGSRRTRARRKRHRRGDARRTRPGLPLPQWVRSRCLVLSLAVAGAGHASRSLTLTWRIGPAGPGRPCQVIVGGRPSGASSSQARRTPSSRASPYASRSPASASAAGTRSPFARALRRASCAAGLGVEDAGRPGPVSNPSQQLGAVAAGRGSARWALSVECACRAQPHARSCAAPPQANGSSRELNQAGVCAV